MTIREVEESPVGQGPNESVRYSIEFGKWGTPNNPVLVDIFLKRDLTHDLSDTLLTGSPTINGTKVITPYVHSLTPEAVYILRVTPIINSDTVSGICEIHTDKI